MHQKIASAVWNCKCLQVLFVSESYSDSFVQVCFQRASVFLSRFFFAPRLLIDTITNNSISGRVVR